MLTNSGIEEVDAGENTLRIGVLGPLRADRDGESLPLGGPKQQRVLALLAAFAPQPVSSDVLALAVYGEETPDRARRRIQTYVSTLRSALGDVIIRSGDGWYLDTDQVELDVRLFETAIHSAKHRRAVEAASILSDTLVLWRGTPYGGLDTHGELDGEVIRLEELRLHALEARIDADLAAGRATALVGELSSLVAEYPYREGLRSRHMLALYRAGRQEEALRSFTAQRELLIEELGVDPGPELTALEGQILRQDDALLLSDEPEGQPLRGYRLLEPVFADNQSTLWRATQPSMEREVAVRQIEPALSDRPEFVRQFESHAQAIARLEHPQIVPLIDFWRDRDGAFLVTRWPGETSLAAALEDRPLSAIQSARVIRQVGEALAAAHRSGITHGQVSAASVWLDEDGNAFLASFGAGVDLATFGQKDAGFAGRRADVAALGALARECFGEQAASPELAFTRMTDAGLSPAIIDVIKRAADPNDRSVESVDEFLAALDSEGASDAGTVVDLQDFVNPYRGLRSFEEADADVFFGRTTLVDEMLGQLAGEGLSSRVLTVVGPSGSGKSSVVQAGLIPALRAGGVTGSEEWFITSMVPGHAPFEALGEALARIAMGPSIAPEADGLRNSLQALAEDETVLLIIDQLEELFTMASMTDADRFLTLITQATSEPGSKLRVVATLRADHYGEPLQHLDFAPLLKAGALDVTPLTAQELVAVVTEPAEWRGLTFDDGLVARIVAETDRQSSPLPLLQYALAELVERRVGNRVTTAAYDQIGGIEGSIGARAETIFVESTEAEQGAVRRLFARLVNPDQAAVDLRRRALLSDLGEDVDVRSALDAFGAARLLSFDRDVTSREPTVEVAHEALLREWPRLAQWLLEDQGLIRSVDRLAIAANTWREGGRLDPDLYRGARLEGAVQLQDDVPDRLRTVDVAFVDASIALADSERATERERNRRLRRLVAAVGGGLLLALVAGLFAFVQQQRASDRAREASARGLAASATAIAERELDSALLLAANASALDPSSLATEAGLLSVLEEAAQLESFGALPDAEHVNLVLSEGGSTAVFYDELGIIRAFDSETLNPLGPEIETGPLAPRPAFALSADGAMTALASGGELRVWEVETGRLIASKNELGNGPIYFVEFSPQGTFVIAGDMLTQENVVIRLEDEVLLGSVAPSTPPQFTEVTFSSDEQFLFWSGVSAARNGTARLDVFSIPDLEAVGEPTVLDFPGSMLSASPDGSLLAVSADFPRPALMLFDPNSLSPTEPPTTLGTDRLVGTLWSPDSSRLAVVSVSGEVVVFSTRPGVAEVQLLGKAAQPEGAGWLDEDRFALISGGERVVWDLAQPSLIGEPLRDVPASAAEVQPSGRYITSWQSVLTVTEPDGTEREIDHGGRCRSVWAQPFGDEAILGCGQNVFEVKIVDLASGEILLPSTALPSKDFATLNLALSPDGSQFAAVGESFGVTGEPGGFIATYNASDASVLLGPTKLDTWALVPVQWTPDGELLLTGGQNGDLLFVDQDTLEVTDLVTTSRGAAITDISFDPSGETVVVANEFGEVWLVDIASREALGEPLTGAAGQFQSAAISPNDRRVAAIGRDRLLRVWDRETGTIVGSPLSGTGEQADLDLKVRFLDEHRLVTWGDGNVTVWDIAPDSLRARACELAGRQLNDRELQAFASDLIGDDVCAT